MLSESYLKTCCRQMFRAKAYAKYSWKWTLLLFNIPSKIENGDEKMTKWRKKMAVCGRKKKEQKTTERWDHFASLYWIPMIITGIGGKYLLPLHFGSKEKRNIRTNEHEQQQQKEKKKKNKPQLRTKKKSISIRVTNIFSEIHLQWVTLRLSDNDLVFVISEFFFIYFIFYRLLDQFNLPFSVRSFTCYLCRPLWHILSTLVCHSFFPYNWTIIHGFSSCHLFVAVWLANVLVLPKNGFTIQWIAFYSTSNSLLFSPKRSINALLIFLFFIIHRTHQFSSPFHINAAHFCIVKFQAIFVPFLFFSFRLVLFHFLSFFYLLPF